LRRMVCLYWSILVVSSLDSRAKIQEPRQVLFPVSLFLFLSQSPNSPLLCCFLFQFTSSNMSKNVFHLESRFKSQESRYCLVSWFLFLASVVKRGE